ncbi:hypothetical protein CC86DRAFT_368098 [Ophiobolus disseminans]|uniref:F-box domain-containing protein n=1 Tax=Ophiobolus disseminans TaxID=1469910 RepID=A0A6A7A6M7_9PLEO|nr:hypothetical protein CC86DRAFT_368098 [Ophiobolus disseminans]
MCQARSVNHYTAKEIRSMKRKYSPDFTVATIPKRQLHHLTADLSPSSHLTGILKQYGLLEAIISNLSADDLLALALTSKTLHETITPRPGSLENLLGRLRCSGKGIEIRKKCHQKSTYFYTFDCTEYVKCGSETPQRLVETRPCVTCKVATCNECRVHVVYQSIYETSSDPSDPAELPNFSGFVLLKPLEQAILSPHHLPSAEAKGLSPWQDPSIGGDGPYHDQGCLDVPLQIDDAAPPECIEEILDIDLGQQSLMSMPEDSRRSGFPSPVLASLCTVVNERKVLLCEFCLAHDLPQITDLSGQHAPLVPRPARKTEASSIKTCHCTLRKHFLDRWLCLRCYQAEDSTIRACASTIPTECTPLCRCSRIACHVLCLWCLSEVLEDENDVLEADTDGTGSSPLS